MSISYAKRDWIASDHSSSQKRKGRNRHCDHHAARSAKAEKQSRNLSSLLALICILFSSPLFAHNLTLNCPHKSIPFKVELARTPQEQEKGLMFRTDLREDEGMLFLFSMPKSMSMWMKNTPLSLDMIFCNKEGKILAIHENTIPYSLDIIGPVEGTSQVLEILGGTVQKHSASEACILTLDR